MKIRSDFITNSSSSSFGVLLTAELMDGSSVCFRAFDRYDRGLNEFVNMTFLDEQGNQKSFCPIEVSSDDYWDEEEFEDNDESKEVALVNLTRWIEPKADYLGLFMECSGVSDENNPPAKKVLENMSIRLTDGMKLKKLTANLTFGGSAEMYWFNDDILRRVFTEEQTEQLIRVMTIEDEVDRQKKLFGLDFLKGFTRESILEIEYMWKNFDSDDRWPLCMTQSLREDGLVEVTTTWDEDPREVEKYMNDEPDDEDNHQ